MGKEFQFYFYVPISHKDIVKNACFQEGAGRMGNYENCCFETLGMGQFKPLLGSKAFLGKISKLEYVQEVKVEMVVQEKNRINVLRTFLAHHPYETPAFGFIEIGSEIN